MNKNSEILQKEVESLVKDFIKSDRTGDTCAGAMWELLGCNSNMAEDEVRYMKEAFLDLLVFIANPDIAEKLKSAGYAGERAQYGKYLKRIMTCLDYADSKHVYAETLQFELSFSQLDDHVLLSLQSEYSKLNTD